MSVRALFFDLDETLLDYGDAAYAATVETVCRELASDAGVDLIELVSTYQDLNATRWAERAFLARVFSSADGRGIWRQTWRDALRLCGCSDDSMATRALNLYVAHRAASYRLFEDVEGLLQELKGRGLPLALITNGPSDTQRHKLKVIGLEQHFETIIISGEVGAAKPDSLPFQLAISRLDVPAESVWHLGDNIRSDVGGANSAGLTSVWLNRDGKTRIEADPVPHHEISSLLQLMPLLDQQQ